VVDDNHEIIELIQRYTSGTRYNLVGSSEPEQAVDLSIETGAQIIVIDVMMPKIDGWELLGRLRSHPKTSAIPVIVLSILAQEDLAYSLGAQKLVMKPVTQEAFLSALDEILANQSSESQQPR
jgi:CheY-like chemotaxis protein